MSTNPDELTDFVKSALGLGLPRAEIEAALRQLRLAIDLYWTRHSRLPASIEELATEAGTGIYARDPGTGEPYEFSVKPPDGYELCARFTGDSEARGDFWSHGEGRRCFAVIARAIRP